MKYFLTLLISVLTMSLFSQTPAFINYQGAVRDQFGQPLANSAVGIRFEVIQGLIPTTVYAENQTVNTNSLGLFTTQIGKQSPNGLNAINFGAGALILKIGVDVAGGTAYANLGTQTLASVPFSFYASDIPSTYTNNILTIGKASYTLNGSGAVYTGGNGISILSNTIINTAPDQTVSITPGNSNVGVSGTYPNFSVSSSPQLSLLAPGTLSVSNGNTVNINPALSFSNGLLTVGAAGNTVVIPSSSSSSTSLQGGGAATVSTLSANAYSISVPNTTLTNGTNVAILGAYPAFTISATPSLAITGNTLSVSGGNSVTLPASSSQSLSLSAPNSLSISGSNSISLPTPAITGLGAASVSSLAPNNFTVNVPQPTLSIVNGSMTISGGNSVSLPAQVAQSLTLLAPNTVSISGGNTISIPAGTLIGTGVASVTPFGFNSFSVNVPQPSLSIFNGSITILGGNSVSLPAQVAQSLTLLAPNTVSISGGNTISIPAGTLIGTGVASVTPFGFNSFSVNVPQPSLSIFNGSITILGGNSVSLPAQVAQSLTLLAPNTVSISGGNTISIPAGTLIGTGIASVTPFGFSSFSVNVPQTNVNPGTNVQVNGAFPNYTIAATPQLSINSNSLSISGGNTIVLPAQVGQSLTVNGNSLSITNGNTVTLLPTLSSTNNVLSVGPTTNSITLATPTIVGTGAITSNVLGANSYSLNVPVTQLSQGTNVLINGIFPNFTIAAIPQLALNSNTLSITGGNTVVIPAQVNQSLSVTGNTLSITNGNTVALAPTLSSTNNVLTVGPGSNSITLATPTIVGSGAMNATVLGPNSYSLDVPLTQLSQGPNILISGSYPSFTIASSPVLSISSNTISISNGNSIQIPSVSLTTAGMATLNTSGSSYTVGVPMWTYTNTSGVIGSGTNTLNITPQLIVNANTVTVGSNTAIITGLLSGGVSNFIPRWNSANSLTSGSQLFDDGTNVGVGNILPTQKLDITGNLRLSGALMPNGAAGTAGQLLQSAGGGLAPNWVTSGLLAGGTTNYLPKWNSATGLSSTSLIFDDGTNVGIGNASPAAQLHVTSAGFNLLRLTTTGANNNVNFDAFPTGTGNLQITAGSSINNGLSFVTNNASRLMITGSGNVGIGNLSPNAPLQFTNALASRKIVLYETANNDNQFYGFGINSGSLRYQTDNTASDHAFYAGVNSTGSVELLRIRGTGNVGIGISSPVTKLDVSGDIRIPATSSYSYATPKTNYVAISANNFVSIDGLLTDGNATGNARWISSGIVGLTSNLYGGFQVPNGATITAIDVYVYDVDATYNLSANLVTFNMPANSIGTSVNTTNTTGSPGIASLGLSVNVVVNNFTTSYFIKLNTYQNNANLWIRGARITYIVDQAD